MRFLNVHIMLAIGAALCLGATARTAAPDPAGIEFFEKNIRPVLANRCYNCHSAKAEKLKGKLLLDTRAGILAGGEGGPIIVPGDPVKSRLITALLRRCGTSDAAQASACQGADRGVRAMGEDGRTDPRTETVAAPVDPYNWAEAKRFWSFQPIQNPPVPQVADASWALTPVDNFLMAGYEEHRLHPLGRLTSGR